MQSRLFPLTLAELAEICRKNSYHCPRILGNSRTAAIRDGVFHYAIIVDVDAFGCNEVFEYVTAASAIKALADWNTDTDAEPIGWIRHMPSGRRHSGINVCNERDNAQSH